MDENTACLVEPDAESLAKGWLRLLMEDEWGRKRGLAAAEKVDSQYSLKRFKSRVVEAYIRHLFHTSGSGDKFSLQKETIP